MPASELLTRPATSPPHLASPDIALGTSPCARTAGVRGSWCTSSRGRTASGTTCTFGCQVRRCVLRACVLVWLQGRGRGRGGARPDHPFHAMPSAHLQRHPWKRHACSPRLRLGQAPPGGSGTAWWVRLHLVGQAPPGGSGTAWRQSRGAVGIPPPLPSFWHACSPCHRHQTTAHNP